MYRITGTSVCPGSPRCLFTGTSTVTVFGLTQVRAGSTAPSLNLTELACHHERDRYGNRTVMSQVVPGVPVPVRQQRLDASMSSCSLSPGRTLGGTRGWRPGTPPGSGVVWRVSVSGSPRWSGGRLGRVRRGRPPSRPRGKKTPACRRARGFHGDEW
jgi:hypothetical protein